MSVPVPGHLTPAERSKRSILVGSIPGDTTEDQLRLLFLQFGSIVDFKFFNDNAGNQIGYAFCEYENTEMAIRALRQLNNFQFRGQFLKVDSAANNKSQEELESFLQGKENSNVETNSGDFDTAEKAPEEISKAVASLPPEQMFELMKQMKMCIENNPHEARNLLLQNPQLAYALLQAQVIMRIVDPEVAMKILDRPINLNATPNSAAASEINSNHPGPGAVAGMQNAPLFPSGMSVFASMQTAAPPPIAGVNPVNIGPPMNAAPVGVAANKTFPNDQDMRIQFRDSDMRSFVGSGIEPQVLPVQNSRMQDPRAVHGPEARIASIPDSKAISVSGPQGIPISNPRLTHDPRVGPDPRGMPIVDPRAMAVSDPRGMPIPDPRAMSVPDPRAMPVPDPRAMPVPDPRAMPLPDPRAMAIPEPRTVSGLDTRVGPDPRSLPASDPRNARQDPRMLQNQDPRRMMPGTDPRMLQGLNSKLNDGKSIPGSDPHTMMGTDPRMSGTDPRALTGDPRVVDPRMRQGSDPRLKPGIEDPRKMSTLDGVPVSATRITAGTGAPTVATAAPGAGGPLDSNVPPDQEKAALIMQVLQLSEEQIAMLPPDQRQSILILKEQIARTQMI